MSQALNQVWNNTSALPVVGMVTCGTPICPANTTFSFHAIDQISKTGQLCRSTNSTPCSGVKQAFTAPYTVAKIRRVASWRTTTQISAWYNDNNQFKYSVGTANNLGAQEFGHFTPPQKPMGQGPFGPDDLIEADKALDGHMYYFWSWNGRTYWSRSKTSANGGTLDTTAVHTRLNGTQCDLGHRLLGWEHQPGRDVLRRQRPQHQRHRSKSPGLSCLG